MHHMRDEMYDHQQNESPLPCPAAGHRFGPREVLAAIEFHLVDERIASRVAVTSTLGIMRRLERSVGRGVEVPQSLWDAMSNRDRLRWLLTVSRMAYRVGGDHVAVVEPAA